MFRLRRHVPFIVLGLASCTSHPDDASTARAQRAISDELHQQGTVGFLFLPPMVPRPAQLGDLVTDAAPVVRVDEITPAGVTLRTLATFTTTSGPNRERIRVHRAGTACDPDDDDGDADPEGYFLARWHTNNVHLSASATYRVRVLVPARGSGLRELGFADVDVVRNEREFRSVDRAEFTPLVNGRTLRIKFRVDRPAVDRDRDGALDWRDNCPTVANPDQRDTLRNGVGDACRCADVTCAAADACHAAGSCQPTAGACTRPNAPDGTACPLDGATGRCQSGACTRVACAPGRGDCDGDVSNGCEADLTTAARCGACDHACPAPGPHATASCVTGACATTCDAGFADCDGDRANGCEVNTTADDTHCGACGTACTAGRTCVAGACSAAACAAGLANCDGAEANGCEVTLANDSAHCGACNVRCAFPHAAATCAAGACVLGACEAGFGDCDGVASNGCEVDLRADRAHCGACNAACSYPGAAGACVAGMCAMGACAAGRADCDGAAGNGCEVALDGDVSHCGACGAACVAPHATPVCAGGACGVGRCDAGWADCDGAAGNGCEADLSAVSACGACGRACAAGPHATATCAAGACGLTCEAGWSDCDGDVSNGCEVNTAADNAHCGACGVACTAGRTCVAGACSAAVCAAGLANCDGAEANGCEVTLASDASHCGACGVACGFPNARGECSGGACGFSVCDAGWGDCDGDRANGCEVDLESAQHCGGCGVSCDDRDDCTADACGAGGTCTHTLTAGDLRCVACTTASACGAGNFCTSGRCCAGDFAVGGSSQFLLRPGTTLTRTFCLGAEADQALVLTRIEGGSPVRARLLDPAGHVVLDTSLPFLRLTHPFGPSAPLGTYTVELTHAGDEEVTVHLSLRALPTLPVGVAQVEGPAVTVSASSAQPGRIEFDGVAGERIALRVEFSSVPVGDPLRLVGPAGSALAGSRPTTLAAQQTRGVYRLQETGRHSIVIEGYTGTVSAQVERVPEDLVVTALVGGGTAVGVRTHPMQDLSFVFTYEPGMAAYYVFDTDAAYNNQQPFPRRNYWAQSAPNGAVPLVTPAEGAPVGARVTFTVSLVRFRSIPTTGERVSIAVGEGIRVPRDNNAYLLTLHGSSYRLGNGFVLDGSFANGPSVRVTAPGDQTTTVGGLFDPDLDIFFIPPSSGSGQGELTYTFSLTRAP